jgi:hypothetical protein
MELTSSQQAQIFIQVEQEQEQASPTLSVLGPLQNNKCRSTVEYTYSVESMFLRFLIFYANPPPASPILGDLVRKKLAVCQF